MFSQKKTKLKSGAVRLVCSGKTIAPLCIVWAFAESRMLPFCAFSWKAEEVTSTRLERLVIQIFPMSMKTSLFKICNPENEGKNDKGRTENP